MNQGICLATNYLTMTEASLRVWTDLDQHLASKGLRLVLLSSTQPATPASFPLIPIPFLLRDYASAFPRAALIDLPPGREDARVIEADCVRSGGMYGPAEASVGLQACRGFLHTVLDALKPSQVLTWDATSPLAEVLKAMCHAESIPVHGVERGFLPETWMIDSRGLQGWSDIRTHWLADTLRHAPANPKAFEKIRTYYTAGRPEKYEQVAPMGAAGLRAKLGLSQRKVVVYVGNYDPCGLAPKHSSARRYNSPVFASTNEALLAVWSAVERSPDTALIFKPHPIDRDPYAVAKVEGVVVVRDANPRDLFELADVVAAQFTTLQYEAVFHDKPILSLANAAWSGWDATYEVTRRSELPQVLAAALSRERWEPKRNNARKFLTLLMEHYLVGCNSAAPARRRLADLASFLARTALDQDHLPPMEVRMDALYSAVEQLTSKAAPELLPVSP
jgi:hypothetical protein